MKNSLFHVLYFAIIGLLIFLLFKECNSSPTLLECTPHIKPLQEEIAILKTVEDLPEPDSFITTPIKFRDKIVYIKNTKELDLLVANSKAALEKMQAKYEVLKQKYEEQLAENEDFKIDEQDQEIEFSLPEQGFYTTSDSSILDGKYAHYWEIWSVYPLIKRIDSIALYPRDPVVVIDTFYTPYTQSLGLTASFIQTDQSQYTTGFRYQKDRWAINPKAIWQRRFEYAGFEVEFEYTVFKK